MSKPAIQVEGLWKEYVVGSAQQSHSTFYDLLSHSIKAPFNRLRNLGGASEVANQFWALRDVNFEVQPGEVLGIIGRNGAGKSTLLKILSRITSPTRGRVTVQGRMASLLEVGTGFHPELSGRENIYLNGSLLGMMRADIKSKFDSIVEFAEIEKFIDTPVKRYSSGMYVRLAFAVASHLEPEILVVDEVLAVGDIEFQKKCLGKMQDVSGSGRTVLFVSHNMNAVEILCTKALMLDKGSILHSGPTDVVVGRYLENVEANAGVIEKTSGVLRIISARGECNQSSPNMLDVFISITMDASREVDDLIIDFGLENKVGTRIMQIVPQARGVQPYAVRKNSKINYEIRVSMTMLAPGDYFGTVFAHSRTNGSVLHQSNIPLFRVASLDSAPECMSAGFTAVSIPNYEVRIFSEE